MKYTKSNLYDMQNLDEIYDLLIENHTNPKTRFHPSAGDFSFLVNFEEELDDFKSKAFQWRDNENTLVGIAWADFRGTYYICTKQENDEIFEIILSDIESELPQGKELWLWHCETNTDREAVLKKKNYSTNGWYMFYGRKSLVDFSPLINLPNGYTIRELDEMDLQAKVELMRISMGDNDSRTVDKYRNMQKSPVYDKRTDLVVVDCDNTIVAFINGWFDKTNAIGAIEPCGTSEEHAGKGLMTALMNYLFDIYKKNDITDVYIPHGGLCTYEDENDDAMRLYKKLGFNQEYRMYIRIKNYNISEHDEYENQAHSEFCRL